MDRAAAPPLVVRCLAALGWAVPGIVGWLGLDELGVTVLAQPRPQPAFDLNLIIDAARGVAVGAFPCDPAAASGHLLL